MVKIDGMLQREFATFEPETAGARTFTEDEHTAIVASRVEQETASLQELVSAKDAEIAELKGQVDAKAADLAALQEKFDVAEVASETAAKELEDFKAEVAREQEIASRMDDRVKAMRELLPSKDDEYFAERAKSWAEKSDEDFEAYKAEIAEAVGVVSGDVASAAAPETAMAGKKVVSQKSTTNAASAAFYAKV